jgi:uncharacterized protein
VISKVTRRKFLGRTLGAAAGLAIGGVGDAFLFEPKHPIAKHVDVYLRRLPSEFYGFRIAQISDIHFGPFMGESGVERALAVAQPFRPDLIVLTGDFVSHPWGRSNGPAGARNAEPCADALAKWKESPLLAILGNHDHWNGAEIVAAALQDRAIHLLRNSTLPFERGGQRIWLAGIDDALIHAADLAATMNRIPSTETTILLSHEPDFADYAARFPIDLQLSGHSHGGQVRVPGIGALILPEMATKYPSGLYQVGELQLYTNCGLGVVAPPVRFNCPPEVSLLTLQGRA